MRTSKSLVGQKRGKLLILERLNTIICRGTQESLYRCMCDCGEEVIFPSHKLSHNKSCGCLPTGTKSKPFSDEEAKEIINLFKDKKSMRFIGAKFHRGTDSIKEFLILNGLNILPRGIAARKGTPREAAARHVWRPGYRDGCSFEFFLKMSQENCFYCGTPPSNRAKPFANKKNHTKEWQEQSIFIYNGLDRIDSSRDHRDHSEDNLVPACKICNLMKREYSQDFFLSHIKKIHDRLNL